MSEPLFPPGLSVPVRHAKSGATYHLIRLDELEATPARLDELVAANNEPDIHRWIWGARLGHEPYPPELAEQFLTWASEGWQDTTHFVFGLLAPTGELAAALDIKSPELGGAEIGYWLRAAHGGVMTNAVTALAGVARRAGFQALTARVREGNARSAAVLARAGFAPDGEEAFQGAPHRKFRLDLCSSAPCG